jgi:hypothetical protein
MLRIIRNIIKGEASELPRLGRRSLKYEERELVERSANEDKSVCSEREKEVEEEYYKVFVM